MTEWTPKPRIVCQFSCGAASAVATKLMLSKKYPYPPLIIVNAFIEQEHADNRRFLADCERWFEHPVMVLRDEKYGASTDEVWRRKKYMKGPKGAPCSMELKRKLLAKIADPGDLNVIGYTAEEGARFLRFRSGPRKNERMWLRELPPGRGNMAEEASFSCSFFCEMAEQNIQGAD